MASPPRPQALAELVSRVAPAPDLAALTPLPQLSPYPRDSHPAAVYLSQLAPSGRATMAGHLNRVALLLGSESWVTCPWHLLRWQHGAAVLARLRDKGHQPSTIGTCRSAIRGVLRAAFRLGLIDAETYHRAIDLPVARGRALPRGRVLTEAELRGLLEACKTDRSPTGLRDDALIHVLVYAGLRRVDACNLDFASVDLQRGCLRVRGKGQAERWVYLPDDAVRALRAWMEVRRSDPGPLFCRLRWGNPDLRSRLSVQGVSLIVIERGRGLPHFTPHDLRRTFASDLLSKGDLPEVQRLLGHVDPKTTMRYDLRGEAGRRALVLGRRLGEAAATPGEESGNPKPPEDDQGKGE